MNDTELFVMIAGGESFCVEFKRQLDLDGARGKAEFIKDIISLANSADPESTMLIGLDDDGVLVGSKELEEGRIQQIVHAYVTPPLRVSCEMVILQSPALLIGVIKVKPIRKPHMVSKAIEHVGQYKVFTRHGSIVTEATPEEIILMSSVEPAVPDSRVYNFIKAAETHARVGDYGSAVRAYSEAIEIAPSIPLYLGRADAYQKMVIPVEHTNEGHRLGRLAYSDYTRALKLASTPEMELEIRRRRWQIFYVPEEYGFEESDNFYDQEFSWLKDHLMGKELGEVIYFNMKMTADNSTLIFFPEAESELTKAIELGYETPEVYCLRAEARFYESNFGLALADIDRAIVLAGLTHRQLALFYSWRANILSYVRSRHSRDVGTVFSQAHEALTKARQLSGRSGDHLGYIGSDLEIRTLYTYALRHIAEEGARDRREIYVFQRVIVQQLSLWFGDIRARFPRIEFAIRDLVGKDFWDAHRDQLM